MKEIQGPVRIISHTMVYENIERKTFPKPIQQMLKKLENTVHKNPEQGVKDVLVAIENHPNLHTLYNFLETAYRQLGDKKQLTHTIQKAYELFPNYLFAKCSYARLQIEKLNLNAVPKIFNDIYNLGDLYPERTEFGAHEFIVHSHIMGTYFAIKGDPEQAQVYLDLMEQIYPDHPAVDDLENKILFVRLKDSMKTLLAKVNKKPKKRSPKKKQAKS